MRETVAWEIANRGGVGTQQTHTHTHLARMAWDEQYATAS